MMASVKRRSPSLGARRLHHSRTGTAGERSRAVNSETPAVSSTSRVGPEHSHRRGTQKSHGPHTERTTSALSSTALRCGGVTNNTASSGTDRSRPRTSAVTSAAACAESRCSDSAEAWRPLIPAPDSASTTCTIAPIRSVRHNLFVPAAGRHRCARRLRRCCSGERPRRRECRPTGRPWWCCCRRGGRARLARSIGWGSVATGRVRLPRRLPRRSDPTRNRAGG
jgi:hypothetical protein